MASDPLDDIFGVIDKKIQQDAAIQASAKAQERKEIEDNIAFDRDLARIQKEIIMPVMDRCRRELKERGIESQLIQPFSAGYYDSPAEQQVTMNTITLQLILDSSRFGGFEQKLPKSQYVPDKAAKALLFITNPDDVTKKNTVATHISKVDAEVVKQQLADFIKESLKV